MKGWKNCLRNQCVIILSEAILMAKLVEVMRQEIFNWELFQFSGDFPTKCEENSVPTILKTLCQCYLMSLMYTIKTIILWILDQFYNTTACAYVLMSNLEDTPQKTVNISKKEKPFSSLYRFEYSQSNQKQKDFKHIHRLGISISYNCVIELENCLVSAICKRFS